MESVGSLQFSQESVTGPCLGQMNPVDTSLISFSKYMRRLMRSPCCLSMHPSASICLCITPPHHQILFLNSVHIVSKENRLLVLPRTSCLRLHCEISLFSMWVSSPQFFVFYVVRVISKGSRRIVLSSISCNIIRPSTSRFSLWSRSIASSYCHV
jgi:hypothetical protein